MSLSENVMAELTAGTGGTYFHNSNDLNGGFERLAAAPEYLYMLEFSIADRKPNGRYHRLKVKVNQEGLSVQSRRGYFAPKPAEEIESPALHNRAETVRPNFYWSANSKTFISASRRAGRKSPTLPP